MDVPSVQIGQTNDRVAAGNTIQVIAASGDVITALAVTPIKTDTVAFQKVKGKGWIAFDPSVSSITSSKIEIRRKRNRRKKRQLISDRYFFKGLVRFLDKQLYKGGDNTIVRIDSEISSDKYVERQEFKYLLGMGNVGNGRLDFVAVWRRNDDLFIYRTGIITRIENWFLQKYIYYTSYPTWFFSDYPNLKTTIGYSVDGKYLGPAFYGINSFMIKREINRSYYNNAVPLTRYDERFVGIYYLAFSPFPYQNEVITWGFNYSTLPFQGNLGTVTIPTLDISLTGQEVTKYQQSDGDTSSVHSTTTKTTDEIIDGVSPIISCNFGQIIEGTQKEQKNLNITFNTTQSSVSRSGYFQFLRNVTGVRVGRATIDRSWTVYLSESYLVDCSYSELTIYGGDLTIRGNYLAQNSGSVSKHDPISGSVFYEQYGYYPDTGGTSPIYYRPIFSSKPASSSFTQEGTTTEEKTVEINTTNLLLSGNNCFIYTEYNYSCKSKIISYHMNDTDAIYPSDGFYTSTGFRYCPNAEDSYWEDDFRPPRANSNLIEIKWFPTFISEEWEMTHHSLSRQEAFSAGIYPTFDSFDRVKFRNTVTDSLIEIDVNSIALYIPSTGLVVGRQMSINYSDFDVVELIDGYRVIWRTEIGITPIDLFFDVPLKYTITGDAPKNRRQFRDSTIDVTVERISDDTRHNAIWDSIASREYDIIWKEGDSYYIGDAIISSPEISITEIEKELFNYLSYTTGKRKILRKFNLEITSKKKINACLLEHYHAVTGNMYAVIVSKDNYYNYLVATNALRVYRQFEDPNIETMYYTEDRPFSDSPTADKDKYGNNVERWNQTVYNLADKVNLFMRDNPVIATANIPLSEEITDDSSMYAEILELLPDGRWVRREEENSNTTAMNLGTPDITSDLWSYYKE